MVTPVGGVGGAAASAAMQGVRDAAAARPAASAGADFGGMVRDGLESVSQAEFAADAAVQDLATGGDTRIEDVMVATTQAQLGVELLAKVRDRALDAYTEIMRMPL